MKKFLIYLSALSLCLCLSFSMAACGDDDDSGNTPGQNNNGGDDNGGNGGNNGGSGSSQAEINALKNKLNAKWADVSKVLDYLIMREAGESTSACNAALEVVTIFSPGTVQYVYWNTGRRTWDVQYTYTVEYLSGTQIRFNGVTYRCEFRPFESGDYSFTYLALINEATGYCDFNLGKYE